MQEWITALIGAGGALGGAGIGYRGAVGISRRERTHARKVQMRDAFASYFGRIIVCVGELNDLPPRQEPNALDRDADAIRGEAGSWVARRRAEFRLTGDRYREIAAQAAMATAQLLVLPLPPDVRSAVDTANDYIERLGQDRTPEIKAEWSKIHARLVEAGKALHPAE